MTITVDLRSELEAELSRQAASSRRTAQEVIDACAKAGGLLTDEEEGTLFHRNLFLGVTIFNPWDPA